MKYLFLSVICILMSSHLSSQIISDFPVITTTTTNDKPIELKSLNISVFVVENIATTTFEMQFYNYNDRVMEGELNFPLAHGVTISRFALDVNGEMREGVVVEKEKATQALEAIIRQNIDPGLVEVTRGNNFKARVYPIPSRGYKKAIIAFEQELTGDEENFIYQLPVNFKHKLEEFAVAVEVVLNRPKVLENNHPAINLEFTSARNSYISEYHAKNILLETQLAFAVPKPKIINKILTYKGSVDPFNYFYINISPSAEFRSKPKPSSITIVWDESASGKNRDIDKELYILDNYINWIQNGTIELLTFSNVWHSSEKYTIDSGNCTGLIKRLKDSKFDGATNIGSIDFNNINTDEILLFTDGISNFGAEPELKSTSPVFAVNSSNIADHYLLEYFASVTNGIYINAFNLTDNEAIELLTSQQKRFIKAEYDSQNISEFYPGSGEVVNSSFSCAGKAEGRGNEIIIHFGYGNSITESYTVAVDNTNPLDNNVIERIWAQKKLRSLMVQKRDNEVIAHGKKYSLVTPGTSLIVLDLVEDYVRYEITPPESLLQEYNKLISQKMKTGTQTREQRMANIFEQFKADIRWWETVGDYRKQAKVKQAEVPQPSQVMSNIVEEEMEPLVFEEQAQSVAPPPPVSEILSIVEDDVDFMVMDEEVQRDEIVIFGSNSSPNWRRQISNISEIEPGSSLTFASSLNIKKWESNAEYMSDMKGVDAKDMYTEYLKLKPANEDNPSFYFDIATYMFQKDQRENGLRVISNLAELELENTDLMRVLGRKLSEHKFYDEAIFIFNKVLALRSFEPHSFIDIGLTYIEQGEYQKAIDNLYAVIDKDWDPEIISRFRGIEVIVLHDINNLIFHHKDKLDITGISECFVKHMPVDIRVLIDWDANDTDIDLWITDPLKEQCSYKNKETQIGGKISNDITQGYGPEEFRLKHAVSGKYVIEANFYGSNKQTVMGNVTVRATVYTNFGSYNEHKEIMTLQLEPLKTGKYTIGEIKFEE